ncbi:MAG: hypothetical protein PHC34_00040 [Candidatus Gastranaerophilales bacterium]|nr:hypothetical protein [Candidatus Gastranaerophilales bacterium]
MKYKAMTLMEALIVAVIIAIVTLPTIDLLAKMIISEDTFNNDINSKEYKTAVTEKLIATLMPGNYLYTNNTSITIPSKNDTDVNVTIGTQAIAVLTPKFNSDGTLNMPSTSSTSFKGTAFSIMPESVWNGGSSSKYVLVETVLDNSSLNLAIDPNDSLKINTFPPTDWSEGKSFVIATNLKPATFTNQSAAFIQDTPRSSVQFAFVPKADGLYFPDSQLGSTQTINDSVYVTSVNLRNWRETTY